jgi:D-lactate dehydrogenase
LCATACPVDIDTGSLVKHLRSRRHAPLAEWLARQVARHFGLVERALRVGLRLAGAARKLLGDRALTGMSRVARVATRGGTILWLPPMPAAARGLPATERQAAAVYVPSCLTRTLGALPGEAAGLSPAEALVAVSRRAGRPVWIPPDVAGHCCGVPFSSKGYGDAHRQMAVRTVEALWRWSEGGRVPVVMDTSPCSYGLRASRSVLPEELASRFDRLRIDDALSWVAHELLPRLTVLRRKPRVVLHPVCSAVKMGLVGNLERIARACAEDVVMPASAGCCAFAGDRGWLVPELTAAATRAEAAEARSAEAQGHYSSSRTCEIGMTRATGRVYRSFLHLVEEATRPG